jgi:predicted component of type VI protein secretion system
MASGRTLLRFHQAPFKTLEARDSHVLGWTSLLDKLTTYLETVQ